MSIVIGVANVVAILAASYAIWRKESDPIRKYYWPGLLLKLMAGVGVGLLYSFHYRGDTFIYFDDASRLSDLAYHDIGTYLKFLWSDEPYEGVFTQEEPRALFFARLVSIVNLITADSYWLDAIWLSWLSFFAAWGLCRLLNKRFEGSAPAAVFAFLFFPSVVFWSSGLIKESIAMATLYGLAALFLRIWFLERIGIGSWLAGVLCLYLLWNLKYYHAAVLLPVAGSVIIAQRLTKAIPAAQTRSVWVWVGCLLLLMLLMTSIHPNFYLSRLFQVIVDNYEAYATMSRPEDMIMYRGLSPDWHGILMNAPWAFISGIFRPWVWEAGNVFQLAAALENLCVLVLAASFIIVVVRDRLTSRNALLVWGLVAYVIILDIFLALSTPNFGTLIRYRVGFMPFLVFLFNYRNAMFDVVWSRLTTYAAGRFG